MTHSPKLLSHSVLPVQQHVRQADLCRIIMSVINGGQEGGRE